MKQQPWLLIRTMHTALLHFLFFIWTMAMPFTNREYSGKCFQIKLNKVRAQKIVVCVRACKHYYVKCVDKFETIKYWTGKWGEGLMKIMSLHTMWAGVFSKSDFTAHTRQPAAFNNGEQLILENQFANDNRMLLPPLFNNYFVYCHWIFIYFHFFHFVDCCYCYVLNWHSETIEIIHFGTLFNLLTPK